jgi:hypothetical protein
MALTDGNGLSAADIAAVTGNNNGGFFGGDGSGLYWMFFLFLFAMMGGWNNGFGGGFGGNNGYADMQRGFDQQSVMAGINGINNALASAEVSRCNAQTNLLQSMNGISMGLQQCCCDNRAGLADLKYTVATENCADRAAVSDGIRDVITAQAANTQNLINSTNAGLQNIMDKICQLELDAKNDKIADLQRQLAAAQSAASQNAQTSAILADNAAQTAFLRQSLNPTPIPAYVVQNPSCCNTQNFCGCNG